ncbi:MAG: MBL fold metallo-hydrolase [Alphaproteobacteria bacterium]|nr:MBL fold metallo-hydrolase [Alphaproteobacteria bacterium]MCW5740463.1 MBL fold metallo-hydrolase [Alphaproteobacteria bacterium]
MATLTLTCLGAAGTVTGSRHLLDGGRRRVLIDCGLFQGLKQLRLKNWAPFAVPPETIDGVVLTHAHLDHSGYLPKLVREGFRGPVYCTHATAELCRLLLLDSAKIQESDAAFANKHGFSKHRPALPLYDQADAERALERLVPIDFAVPIDLGFGARLMLRRAGHILGAATAEIEWGHRRIAFSGDLGRYGDPLMADPAPIGECEELVVESTYGDRLHARIDPAEALLAIVERTVGRGGTMLIPAFAVGRAQELLHLFWKLKRAGRIPLVPIYLDSPMATDAGDILQRHPEDHRLSPGDCRKAMAVARYVQTVEESRALSHSAIPKVVISASGMLTGGRVLHHLRAFGPDPRTTVLFAGFQAAGTRGAALLAGAMEVKMYGQLVPIRAEIDELPMLSAHADAGEIMRWLGGFRRPPRRTFIVHGEEQASAALAARIRQELGWRCVVPNEGQAQPLN